MINIVKKSLLFGLTRESEGYSLPFDKRPNVNKKPDWSGRESCKVVRRSQYVMLLTNHFLSLKRLRLGFVLERDLDPRPVLHDISFGEGRVQLNDLRDP